MGGNDLEFSEILKNCVLKPWNSPRSWTDPKCEELKSAARKKMTDTDEIGLTATLQAAYKRILDKSGRKDMHVYVTTYPMFFNEVDKDCDRTIFNFWWAKYDPPWDSRNVYLTTDLREELNNLVLQLNSAIHTAVRDVNAQHGGEQVHVVEVNPKFDDRHRWCEEGDFHEPDSTRQDTWFFLSGWPDVQIFDAAIEDIQQITIEAQEATQISEYVSAGSITLPDAASCRNALGTDPDPWAVFLCDAAQDIAAYPEGDWALNYAAANEEAAAGNYTGQHIGWWLPTRQIKTFHPRSPGMVAYRDAIIASIMLNQADTTSTDELDTCTIDIKEMWTCEDVSSNLYAEVTITAPDGEELYKTGQSATSPGQPINDADPLTIDTSYGSVTLVGEHVNDYIQFTSGEYSWTSGTTSGSATCKLVGDDWEGPPDCSGLISREFSCEYPCSASSSTRR